MQAGSLQCEGLLGRDLLYKRDVKALPKLLSNSGSRISQAPLKDQNQ